SPGAATGEVVFDADEAEAMKKKGHDVILVRPETSPEDFHGIVAARAILTARGGMTSHAAVVARGMGKTCVVGAKELDVDPRGGRSTLMREMIVAADEAGRRKALAKLLPIQRRDFEGLFEVMDGLPVTIRLLDPPLHEFLPHTHAEIAALAKHAKVPAAQLERLIHSLVEANPMLGHRGCRLGITYPEITEMQARAIFEAAGHVAGKGKKVTVEIMIPLVADVRELLNQTEIIRRVAQEVFHREGRAVPYLVGTMIELPRAAVTADEIAKEAEFFSFGTNDLTQTTFGLSRDDAGRFLPFYVEHGLLSDDPFQVLDQAGVGKI